MSRFRAPAKPNTWKDYLICGFATSADGYDFWYLNGWLNNTFALYVFKQKRNGAEPSVVVGYPLPLMEKRGNMILCGDGTLRITGAHNDNDLTPREEIVHGFVPYVVGTVPPITTAVDQLARDSASQASEAARLANAQSAQATTAIGAIRTDIASLKSVVKNIPAGITQEQVAQIAWSKAIDYTGTPEFGVKIKDIAQSVLLDAIAYAMKATAAQSRLRALIELIKGTTP